MALNSSVPRLDSTGVVRSCFFNGKRADAASARSAVVTRLTDGCQPVAITGNVA
jgi:hypothetical protein